MSDVGSSLPSVELLEQQLESLAQYTTKLQEKTEKIEELVNLLAESHRDLHQVHESLQHSVMQLIARENAKTTAMSQTSGGYVSAITTPVGIKPLPVKLFNFYVPAKG